MPSRSTLVRWGGLAAVVAGALYVLGALSTALNYPPAYTFTRLHLNAVWGVPLRFSLWALWRGCTPGKPAAVATASWGRRTSCWPSSVAYWRWCWGRCCSQVSPPMRPPRS
jgi:hypothetical protein